MEVLFGWVAAPRRGGHERVTGMRKSLHSFVPALGLLERLAIPKLLANPASGLDLNAWTAANADTSGSIAILGAEEQGGQTHPIVPWAVGPPQRGE